MSELPFSVVLNVYNNRQDLFVIKRDVIAPLRLDRDGIVYALYRSSGYKLYRGRAGALSIFEDEPSVKAEILSVPHAPIPKQSVTSLLGPLLESEGLFEQPVSLNFMCNQFGVYGFFSGPESLLLLLLDYVENKCSARLLAWELGDFESDGICYSARLKFSSFANMDALEGQLTQFLNNLSMKDVVSIVREQVKPDTSATGDSVSLNPETITPQVDDHEPQTIAAPTVTDFDEMEIPMVARKKVSADQKCLREVLMYGFQGIAIHPDSVAVIVNRFRNRKAIINLLSRLSSRGDVRLKKIQGKAGQFGWREVDEHVATGADKRGRVYVRAVDASDHSIDVVIEWKKDDKSQEKTLGTLTSLNSFNDRSVILG